ncbi:MAG: fructosamine kinase family protein [Bacteroidota bacterium]
MSLQTIFNDCILSITRYEPVHGGDINRAWCLYSGDKKYFLKVNDAAVYPGLFEKEAKGLRSLRDNCSLIIPDVIKTSVVEKQQYLLLEWIDKSGIQLGFMKNFGSELARLHQKEQKYFGWKEDNYIGTLPQKNTLHSEWHSFYTECRIMPLVKKLHDSGIFSKQDIESAEKVCNKLEQLFPKEKSSLLHGDLWSGNFMISSNGNAAVYDPAVYYGHREMDLGMTLLFGGFDKKFYEGYNEVYPLEKNWQHRVPLTQLYPLLVHAVLFGGHYIQSVKNNFTKFQ